MHLINFALGLDKLRFIFVCCISVLNNLIKVLYVVVIADNSLDLVCYLCFIFIELYNEFAVPLFSFSFITKCHGFTPLLDHFFTGMHA